MTLPFAERPEPTPARCVRTDRRPRREGLPHTVHDLAHRSLHEDVRTDSPCVRQRGLGEHRRQATDGTGRRATAGTVVRMTGSHDVFGVGSLTDVTGVLVGHHQRVARGWLTGTTVVLAPSGAVAAVDVRGGGPGTRETDALDPRNLVDRIHGICLSGGSAYGLAAADGVMAHLESLGLGCPSALTRERWCRWCPRL
jgi:hypothetical protein